MIGIDIISIPRMERFIDRYGERGLRKFLDDDEIAYVRTARTAAGFWALKEAYAKALKCGISPELRFHDMKIRKRCTGAPEIEPGARVIERFGITASSVSITHDGDYAVAVAYIQM